jgi:diaminopropionate ammonia-lyase
MGTRRLLVNQFHDPSAVSAAELAALRFHRSWPGYRATPLRSAPTAARALGVRSVLVKDESARLGMSSFKMLGASWASHRALCRWLEVDVSEVPDIDQLADRLAGRDPLTLVAATDGNHGCAVARVASLLGLRADILVPADMTPARIDAIRQEGAQVRVVDGSYDDAIAASAQLADETHLLISDTSWEGYIEVPGWVIDGYATLVHEIDQQLEEAHISRPTVVAAQIGVGAFAAAIARGFAGSVDHVVGVEPVGSDCVMTSIEVGGITQLPGRQTSIMAGLNCGTPSPLAWHDVTRGIGRFVAVEDESAETAMRLLAQDGIVSGESGAAGLAGLLAFAGELGLSLDDDVLVISTEGATDRDAWARCVGADQAHASNLGSGQDAVSNPLRATVAHSLTSERRPR